MSRIGAMRLMGGLLAFFVSAGLMAEESGDRNCIQAENFSRMSGVTVEACEEGGKNLSSNRSGDYAVYDQVDFGNGCVRFFARISSETAGGEIELRTGAADGPVIGTVAVPGTLGPQNWRTVSCPVKVSGVHNLYLGFKGGEDSLLNLNWISFANGFSHTLENGEIVQVLFYTDSIVRVLTQKDASFMPTESLVTLADTLTRVPFSVEELRFAHGFGADAGSKFKITTPGIQVVMDQLTGQCEFYKKGTRLLSENGRSYTPAVLNGENVLNIEQRFIFKNEALYGLGQYQDKIMNYFGAPLVSLKQDNTAAVSPFLVSTKGYGILWDNYSVGEVSQLLSYDGIALGPESFYDEDGIPGGLTGRYYNDLRFAELALTRRDTKVDFNFGIGSPDPLVQNDNFSARWTGQIKTKETGEYQFTTLSDDGIRLWVGDELVIDDWNIQSPKENKVRVKLSANKAYDIKLEYFEKGSGAWVRFDVFNTADIARLESKAAFKASIGNAVDYYVVAGDGMDAVIQGYRYLTGPAPMFPAWAYGFMQSRENYVTQDLLLSVATEMKKQQIPCDVIVKDWNWWDETGWNSMVIRTNLFPDYAGMVRQLHDMNLHTIVSIWPNFGTKTAIYKEFKSRGFMIKEHPTPREDCAMYDAWNLEAGRLYWKYFNEIMFSKGNDGWWLDATEPALIWFDPAATNVLGSVQRYVNSFSLVTSESIYKNQRLATDEKRVFILTRSAFSGQQRTSSVTWSGDTFASWDALQKQITAGVNFCASGIPYWSHDIGAFFVNKPQAFKTYPDGNQDPEYRELYTRWYQFGAFTPLFRSHGTHTEREPWFFGKKDDGSFYDSQLRINRLRYRLMPTVYSLAWQITANGYTMMRPLAFDFTNDPAVRAIPDQYMFGPGLMVCPVTIYQATNRSVYLPKGRDWFDLWTGAKLSGGQTVLADAPIDQLPLFVPSGSILLFGPEIQYAREKPTEPIEIRIYPGADASFTLYEDEGDSYRYEKGMFSTIELTWNDAAKRLTIGDRQGQYAGMPASRLFNCVVVIGSSNELMTEKPDHQVRYTGSQVEVGF